MTEGVAAGRRPAPESPLLRRTRRQLLLWSGGSTLVLLVVLGTALYLAVANTLAAASEAQLRARAQVMRAMSVPPPGDPVTVPLDVTEDPSAPGLVFGGPASGTLALIITPDTPVEGAVVGPAPGMPGSLPAPGAEPVTVHVSLPDPDAIAQARAGETTLRTTRIGDTPVRILTVPVQQGDDTFVVQVLGDRTAEERALAVLLAVLVVGGILVLLVALALGHGYAGRALVPIRESLRRQREFAADASHELRTPLAVVRSSVEELRRHRDRSVRDVGPALDDIEAEVQRMTALVDDLLVLARTDSAALELSLGPTDLAELAADALAALEPLAAGRGVRLELDVAPAPLQGDAARLRQLLSILTDNAIRHSPSGGTVRVTVGGAGAVRATVEDEGPGIRPEDLPRVFDRFWRAADAPSGGTGLGLAIAAWIAERHGGRLRAENREGRGARFTLEMPGRVAAFQDPLRPSL